MNITIDADVVAIVGAVISVCAMIISIWQAYISRKSLKLQKKIYDEGKPHFRIKDIINSSIIKNSNKTMLKIVIYPLITNLSDKPMIIEKIRLRIEGETTKIILTPSVHDGFISDGYSIEANHSGSKGICFEIEIDTYNSLKVLKHTLMIEDAYGNVDEKSIVWIKEMLSENEE